jgi:SAM-dependent methyltransferase
MDKNYYPEYYELERSNWWFLARLQIIRTQVKKISSNNKLNILNIGVSTGASSQMLQEFGEVTSIEYDQFCVDFVNAKTNLNVQQGSILELQFDNNQFDLVCAFDVIEHVEDDQLAINEMYRVCKPGGNVIVTVPAFMFLWSKHDVVNHHFRRYTRPQLLALNRQSDIRFCSYFNSILFLPIAVVRMLLKIVPFKRSGSGSDFGLFQSAFLNKLFYGIFISENALLKQFIRLPFGVSIMLVSKKK